MSRLPFLVALVLPIAAAAQSPPSVPKIEITVSGQQGQPGSDGTASVSGKITLPPGWKLSIHTLTIRYAKDGGATTLNAFLPIDQLDFNAKTNLKSGNYSVWAVIDVKDADGKERQISSDKQSVSIP